MNHKQLAAISLQLIAQAHVNVTDADLAAAAAVRQWLKRIASGELVIEDTPKDK